MTDSAKMIHKVNQIAHFFSAYPHDEAVAGVLDHIQKFWEPRMRHELLEHVKSGGAGLDALVVEAAAGLER